MNEGFILFIGSGSYEAPRTGLDNVVKTHVAELAYGQRRVVAIIVSPTIAQYTAYELGKCTVHVYPSVLQSHGKLRILYEKMRLAFLTLSSIHAVSLFSPEASQHIKRLLAMKQHSVILIDYIYSLANIPLHVVMSRKQKIIFISIDVITREAFRNHMQYKRPWWRTAALYSQLFKALLQERIAIKYATVAMFLSEYDRNHRVHLARKSVALLPFAQSVITLEHANAVQSHDNSVVFIGSPGFEPNAFAVIWLVEQLAPSLMKLDPAIKIILVGKGSERYIPKHVTNVQAAGFVSDQTMHAMLRSCIALVCPIIHGGGIKTKILDAIGQRCPIMATAQSLRGYEFFSIEPEIFMDDPDRTARAVVHLARHPEVRKTRIVQLSESLRQYEEYRTGKLAKIVEEITLDAA